MFDKVGCFLCIGVVRVGSMLFDVLPPYPSPVLLSYLILHQGRGRIRGRMRVSYFILPHLTTSYLVLH